MVKDIRPGPRRCATSKPVCRGQGASSNPSQLTVVGKTLYFTADDGIHGRELWRSDGTARGTRLVKDIVSGHRGLQSQRTPSDSPTWPAPSSSSVGDCGNSPAVAERRHRGGHDDAQGGLRVIVELTAVGGTLYFAAKPPQAAVDSGLWRSDGTASGTVLVKAHRENLGGSLTDYRGRHPLLRRATPAPDYGLWRSDGTEAGTILVKEGVAGDRPDRGRQDPLLHHARSQR